MHKLAIVQQSSLSICSVVIFHVKCPRPQSNDVKPHIGELWKFSPERKKTREDSSPLLKTQMFRIRKAAPIGRLKQRRLISHSYMSRTGAETLKRLLRTPATSEKFALAFLTCMSERLRQTRACFGTRRKRESR
jgi:hypothetical protein